MNSQSPRCRTETKEERRARMLRRRERQIARTPGFTAVPNRRVNGAIDTAMAVIMVASAERGAPMNPVAARDEAVRRVARSLPRAAMVRDWRQGLPSKNDNPDYRK